MIANCCDEYGFDSVVRHVPGQHLERCTGAVPRQARPAAVTPATRQPPRPQMKPDAGKARDMLDAFESVGAKAFDVTITDIDGEKIPRRFQANRGVDQLRASIGPLARDRSSSTGERHHSPAIGSRYPDTT